MGRDGLGSPSECQFSTVQARRENTGGHLSKPVKSFMWDLSGMQMCVIRQRWEVKPPLGRGFGQAFGVELRQLRGIVAPLALLTLLNLTFQNHWSWGFVGTTRLRRVPLDGDLLCPEQGRELWAYGRTDHCPGKKRKGPHPELECL